MPPTANNPNPDRASRRSAAPATAETVTEGNNGAADAPPAPALAVAVALQPQPARATAPATANAAQEATEPAPRATVVLKAPTLFNKDGAVAPSRKRKACPTRDAPEWAAVSILNGGESQTPQVQCNFCGKTFCATAARVKNHLLGLNGSAACQGDSEAFIQLKEKLLGKVTEKAETKQRKTAAAAIMSSAMSSTSSSISTGKGFMQQHIQESFAHATSEVCDHAIADFLLAHNIAFGVLDSPYFKAMVSALRRASSSYKPPPTQRMSNALLDSSCNRLRAAEAPMREALLGPPGCTLLCDGWDDIERNHLINLLYATTGASFFQGTTQLTSSDHEDSTAVASFMVQGIDALGDGLEVVHICTDTCAVMQAAWRKVEAERKWISCSCCATHVLSLLLKDIGNIPIVAETIAQMQRILKRFWGRTRWPRLKLKETTAERNHGTKLGLYRARQTRFAGKVRELGRALRLKSDLQEVVVSREYNAKKYGSSTNDVDEDADANNRDRL